MVENSQTINPELKKTDDSKPIKSGPHLKPSKNYKKIFLLIALALIIIIPALIFAYAQYNGGVNSYEACANKQPNSTIKPGDNTITCTYKGKDYTKTFPSNPAIQKSKLYKDVLLSFQHPENWKILKEGDINKDGKVTYLIKANTEEALLKKSNLKAKMVSSATITIAKPGVASGAECQNCEVVDSKELTLSQPSIKTWQVFAKDPQNYDGIVFILNSSQLKQGKSDIVSKINLPNKNVLSVKHNIILTYPLGEDGKPSNAGQVKELEDYVESNPYRGLSQILNSLIIY